jgi:tryptophan-rich sensory protein
MNTTEWYAALIKPSFAPPAWVFGPVWTLLYAIIGITFIFVFYKVYMREIPYLVALPFLLNLLFNLLFTPLQFGLRSNTLASLDILLVVGTLIWALIAIFPYVRIVALANLPYLLWGLFATVLQLTITYLNRAL